MLEQERAKSMAQNMNLGIAEALVKQFGHGARKPSGNSVMVIR
jgi:Rod binding domain-containing protein